MVEESVCKRKLSPLQKINDNYEKIVLSLNTGMDSSYDGIKSINVIDWLLEEYIHQTSVTNGAGSCRKDWRKGHSRIDIKSKVGDNE